MQFPLKVELYTIAFTTLPLFTPTIPPAYLPLRAILTPDIFFTTPLLVPTTPATVARSAIKLIFFTSILLIVPLFTTATVAILAGSTLLSTFENPSKVRFFITPLFSANRAALFQTLSNKYGVISPLYMEESAAKSKLHSQRNALFAGTGCGGPFGTDRNR